MPDLRDMTEDTWLVTLLMVGTKDDEARKKMIQEDPFPSLERARAICSSQEKASKHSSTIKSARTGHGTDEVAKVTGSNVTRRGDRSPARRNTNTGCGYCGSDKFHNKSQCPAKDKECRTCHKVGHFSSVCRSNNSRGDKNINTKRTDTVASVHLVNGMDTCKLNWINVEVQYGHAKATLRCLPDSGSSANLLDEDTYLREFANVKNHGLKKPEDVLKAANGLGLEVSRTLKATARLEGRTTEVVFHVSTEVSGPLLSKKTCQALGILPKSFPKPLPGEGHFQKMIKMVKHVTGDMEDPEKIKNQLLEEFKDVFDDEGPLKVMTGSPATIELTKDAIPVKVTNPRPIPIPLREDVKKLLDYLVAKGVIELVSEPTDWVHPMIVVKKPNGELRLTVDLRELNKYVRRPNYPLPNPRDLVAQIPNEAQVFTTADATSGYFQVPLAEESRDLTTFITPWGRYHHKRLMMGLVSAGDEYNIHGDVALTTANVGNTLKMVDDILLHDVTLESHILRVKKFLQTCRSAGITLNKSKFNFCREGGQICRIHCGQRLHKGGSGKAHGDQGVPQH